MSSDEAQDQPSAAKRRQMPRACDVCRRRKIRCDGPDMLGNRCSVCLAGNLACTYDQPAKRYPTKGYVEDLEKRLAKMEGLMKRLDPSGSLDDVTASITQTAPYPGPSASSLLYSAVPSSSTIASRSPGHVDNHQTSNDEHSMHGLTHWLERLKLDPATPRFHGETASHNIVMNALSMKHEFIGQGGGIDGASCNITVDGKSLRRRTEFWRPMPWERQSLDPQDSEYRQTFDFPPDDLLPTLIEKYFDEFDILFSLMYRPGFERSVREQLHLRNEGFAYVLLLVCAIASPFVDDPRVLIDGLPLSSGWRYFRQVQLVRKSLLAPPSIYDLQICCLASFFLSSSSIPAHWSILGSGIRMAADIGVHRKMMYSNKPNVQEEQWKRAFWVLVTLDRYISMGLGRPTAIQSEDIDVDLPIEVDDEYWEHPTHPFVQPGGKPSKVSVFVSFIKLHSIMGFAMRTIYSIRRSKELMGLVGPEAEQRMVAQLDSSLNEWVDSVPDHLRWDPQRADIIFLHQSAALWSAYYQLQIVIHRPFASPSGPNPDPMAFTSLVICTNAARSCSRVIEVHQRRKNSLVPVQIAAAFTTASVLLMNVWSGARQGLALDPAKEMAGVYRCMYVLKQNERRWPIAGRFWDILTGLVSIGDSTLPAYRPSDKRKHPGGDPSASSPETPSSLSTPPDIAEAPAQAYEPAQHGSLLVGYGLAGFRPMQDATSIGHTQDDRLDLHTESSTSLGLDYLFELGLLETPDPTQAWWPDLGIQFPATLATGLSQDKVSPHGASRDLNPPLSFQPDGVLSADAMQPLSGQPTFSWPGVPDPFQQDEWDTFFKEVSSSSFSH